jgi:isopentenyl-diphosphate delta-isomerase
MRAERQLNPALQVRLVASVRSPLVDPSSLVPSNLTCTVRGPKVQWNLDNGDEQTVPAPSGSSLIDQVDPNDRPVGRVRRGEALRIGANFRTVHVFVFHDQRLLLQRLAPSRERHPCRWGSSVAAYLFAGESYKEAARRRLAEELELRGRLAAFGKTRMEDLHSLKFVELYILQNGPARIREPDHTAELRYWDRDDLEDAIEARSDMFTPTFLHVYRFYRQRLATATI